MHVCLVTFFAISISVVDITNCIFLKKTSFFVSSIIGVVIKAITTNITTIANNSINVKIKVGFLKFYLCFFVLLFLLIYKRYVIHIKCTKSIII